MSAQPDIGLGPKRRTTTTYGKIKQRMAQPSAQDGRNPSARASSTSTSPLTAPNARKHDAPSRQPNPSQLTAKKSEPRQDQKVNKPNALGGSSPAKHPKPIESSSGTIRPEKRKPLQQPAPREVKRQRSSSPDPFAFPPSTPPRASASSPRPPFAKAPRSADPSKGKVAQQSSIKKWFSASSTQSAKETVTIIKQHHVPVRTSQKVPTEPRPKPPPSTATADRPTAVKITKAIAVAEQPAPKSTPAKRRPRLVDALNAQAERSPPSSPPLPSEEFKEPSVASQPWDSQDSHDLPAAQASSPAPAQSETPKATRTFVRQTSMNRKPGVKRTYGQQRSMLADESLLAGVDPDKADELMFSQPLIEPSISQTNSAFDFDDGLMEDPSTSGAVRGIHELRQAGANFRFADEMDDIIDRIGVPSAKPSSMRRGALLETAQKIQEKTFRRQFSIHSNGTSSLLKCLENETDPIAGSIVAAILVTLLGSGASSSLMRQLPLAGLARLATLLLPITRDLEAVALDRKSNMSKYAQTSLAGLKASILKLDAWKPVAPSKLSPCALALKFMHLIAQEAAHPSDLEDLFSAEVTDALFVILKAASEDTNSKCWDFPDQPESTNLFLALSLLETHSITVMQSAIGRANWNENHLPTVAALLETTLKHDARQLKELETLILRLTLNTANHNSEAHPIFLQRGLALDLARATCGMFDSVLKSVADGSFLASVFDSLLLMLGVMINFSEHNKSAAKTLNGSQPLDQLIGFFLDNHSRTAEADSEETSQLNVAFGYLSVLLGYLCRYEPVRRRFESLHKDGNLKPLLSAIREFADVYGATDTAIEQTGEKYSFAHRLQGIADALERAS